MPSEGLLRSIESPSRPVLTALLVVIGLLLVANSLWLFPDVGEVEYTYDLEEFERRMDRL